MDTKQILVIGASNMDICAKSIAPIRKGDSNIGQISMSSGGVGHNIAVALKRLGLNVQFLTAIADDSAGQALSKSIKADGIELLLPLISSSAYRTGIYSYILDSSGTLLYGVNDMSINESITSATVMFANDTIKSSDCVVFEANLSDGAIKALVNMDGKFAADCVSVVKARKLRGVLDKLFLLKANYAEACELAGMRVNENGEQDPYTVAQKLAGKGLQRGLITLGSHGSFCFDVHAFENGGFEWYKMETPKDEVIINTNGCGDAFFAGFLKSYLEDGNLKKALEFGQSIASANARTNEAVTKELFTIS